MLQTDEERRRELLMGLSPEERLRGLSAAELVQALAPEVLQALRSELDATPPKPAAPESPSPVGASTPTRRVEVSSEAPSSEGNEVSQEQWFAMLPSSFADYLRRGAEVLEARAQARDRLLAEYEERAKKLDELFVLPSPPPRTSAGRSGSGG